MNALRKLLNPSFIARRKRLFAAIATEAGTAETENTGSVHEGAGLKGIAQPIPGEPS